MNKQTEWVDTFIRDIQELRKSSGLDVSDRIYLSWIATGATAQAIHNASNQISTAVSAVKMNPVDLEVHNLANLSLHMQVQQIAPGDWTVPGDWTIDEDLGIAYSIVGEQVDKCIHEIQKTRKYKGLALDRIRVSWMGKGATERAILAASNQICAKIFAEMDHIPIDDHKYDCPIDDLDLSVLVGLSGCYEYGDWTPLEDGDLEFAYHIEKA